MSVKKGKLAGKKQSDRMRRLREDTVAGGHAKRRRKLDGKKQTGSNSTILGDMKIERQDTTHGDGRIRSLEVAKNNARDMNRNRKQAPTSDSSTPTSMSEGPMMTQMNPDRLRQLMSSIPSQQTPNEGTVRTLLEKKEALAPKVASPNPLVLGDVGLLDKAEKIRIDSGKYSKGKVVKVKKSMADKKLKKKAQKELRARQKAGKAERRAARDEKRSAYRAIKQTWKSVRGEERKKLNQLTAIEDEENKRLATEVTNMHRHLAMEICAELGFTLENVTGIKDVVPKKRLKGQDQELDLDADYVDLGSAEGAKDYQASNYNDKPKRKLRRLEERTVVKRELLVREAAIKHCAAKGIEVPAVLRSSTKPQVTRGSRTMPDGSLETAAQERAYAEAEMAAINKRAKILRKQERVHLKLVAKNATTTDSEQLEHNTTGSRQTAAQFLDSWPVPKDDRTEKILNADVDMEVAGSSGRSDSSEDSAAKQLRKELGINMKKVKVKDVPSSSAVVSEPVDTASSDEDSTSESESLSQLDSHSDSDSDSS